MQLFLFLTSSGEPFPVGEMNLPEPAAGPPAGGRWARIREDVLRVYRNLVSRLDYHERLCSQLRTVSSLHIHHPTSLGPDEARRVVRGFCRARARKHLLWMWINGILAALGTLLIPVPGPNVFFFFPAARCLGHYTARKGSLKVLRSLPIEYGSNPLVDEIQDHLPDLEKAGGAMGRLGERYNLGNLGQILRPLSEERERK